jgi:hypothetical protein
MTVPFAQQPRALRSTTRIGPTGKLTPARRCSAARVCALSRATVQIPPPSPPTLTLTSVPVRCDRLFGRPIDPSAPPMKRAGGDRPIRSNRPARPRTAHRSAPPSAKPARATVAPATCRSARFAAQPTMVSLALPRERQRTVCLPARCLRPSGAATKGTAGSPAKAGWRPAHPFPDPPAPVGPPQSRRAATPKPRPTPLAGNLFRRASQSGLTHAAPRPRRRCRPPSTRPEARRPLAPTLAVNPPRPSRPTAAGPLPIPAPGPLHRVVPQRSTLLLLPRVSPKVAGLRHLNRAPEIDLWGVRPGLQRHHPANHVPPNAEDVETAMGYCRVFQES